MFQKDILLELTSQVNIEKSNPTVIPRHSVEIKKTLAKFYRSLLKVFIFTFGKGGGFFCFVNTILLPKKSKWQKATC